MPHQIRWLLWSVLLTSWVGLANPLPVSAQISEEEIEEQGSGVQPLSPEEFARLPKTPQYRAFLPERVDLSPLFPKPGNQGSQGSCVGWAVAYAARAYYVYAAEGRNVNDTNNIPSPAFLYNSLVLSADKCNSGTSIVSALNFLKVHGVLSFKEYPYNINRCSRPSLSQQSQAKDFKIDRWEAVNYQSIDQVKGELAKGHPVIISIRTSNAFHKLRRGQIYQVVNNYEDRWHAVPVVGYDENRQAFKIINSWGMGWGDRGFGWISYPSFRSEVREAYVMRPLKAVIPERKETPIPFPPVVQVKPPTPNPAPVVQVDPKSLPTPNLITDIQCGRVEVKQQGGQTFFTGFVGTDDESRKLSDRTRSTNAIVDVAVRPWPQCEVLLTLGKALAEADRPRVNVDSSVEGMQVGEYLRITVESPAYPSFLHAAYIQADGSVVHLIQPDSLNLRAVAPSSRITFGAIDGPGPKFKVSAPFGPEMVIVLASRSPLFATSRPNQETERQFLTDLRKALIAKLDKTAPDRVVSAGFAAIRTSNASTIANGETQP